MTPEEVLLEARDEYDKAKSRYDVVKEMYLYKRGYRKGRKEGTWWRPIGAWGMLDTTDAAIEECLKEI